MAGMKRFVTYIYAYEDRKKGNNVGFAKIEIRGEDCRVEIHLRGIYGGQSVCKVYLFRENEGNMEGIQLGEMRILGGKADFGAMIRAGKIGDSPFGISNMEGIFLLDEEGRIFMSRWTEGAPLEVCRERFKPWTPETVEEERISGAAEAKLTEAEQAKAAAPMKAAEQTKAVAPMKAAEQVKAAETANEASEDQVVRAKENSSEKQSLQKESVTEAEEVVTEAEESEAVGSAEKVGISQTVQATELPAKNIFPEYDWQRIWDNLRQDHAVFTPFEDREAECVQIELKDLRELPKRYWYMGNNSFLLHGFFNYRYLVVGRTGEGRWFIGVPGIYQRQERVMAAIFGFPEFIAVLSEQDYRDKGEPVGHFGCWYRYIEE